MNYKESLDYIHNVERFGSRLGLERMTELLEKLGRPQDGLRFVHIAGTNGKGSCAAMLSSILKFSGYKTGLYTSPYLFKFNERMQINGKDISDDALAAVVTKIAAAADTMEDHPTEFELMTAAALLWYAEEKCDVVVLEVGMGGRFDATNVIENPELCVIMNIGLDHTAILGDTIEKIAFEKAGIVKPGRPCVMYPSSSAAIETVKNVCAGKNAPLSFADFSQIESVFNSTEGQVFTYKGTQYALALLGKHQLSNAAVVIEAARLLMNGSLKNITENSIEHGLYAAMWPARFEVVCEDPFFVVDGGHNPQCAEAVAENLELYFPDTKRVLLVGILADKDYAEVFNILDPVADEYVCVTPDSPRALPAEELAKHLERFGKPVTVCESIEDGVETAKDIAAELEGMACSVGSLYMSGTIRNCFGLY